MNTIKQAVLVISAFLITGMTYAVSQTVLAAEGTPSLASQYSCLEQKGASEQSQLDCVRGALTSFLQTRLPKLELSPTAINKCLAQRTGTESQQLSCLRDVVTMLV